MPMGRDEYGTRTIPVGGCRVRTQLISRGIYHRLEAVSAPHAEQGIVYFRRKHGTRPPLINGDARQFYGESTGPNEIGHGRKMGATDDDHDHRNDYPISPSPAFPTHIYPDTHVPHTARISTRTIATTIDRASINMFPHGLH